MEFIFKATDQEGKIREGAIEAASREAAVALLQKEGLIPVFVTRKERQNDIFWSLKQAWEGANKKELVVFFRQLSILIDARVPIVPSLQSICEQTDNNFLRVVFEDMVSDIEDGMSLSNSIAKHPKVFSPLMINMIRAGEVSGNLQRSITFVADSVEKNYQLTAKIRGALFYPAFVITAAAIVGFLAITFILPRITSIIKDMNIPIPWYTKALMWLGDFMQGYWWAVLAVIIAAVVGFIYYVRTETGKREWDQLKIRIPIVGNLFRYIYMSRFSDNLSVLLAGGIPILKSLILVSDVINNSVYRGIILRSADEVKTGGNASTVLQKYTEIPPMVTRMVKIGEETGKLSEVLGKISGFYEEEVDRMTKNLTELIEPVLIVFLGIGVAVIVFAILLPIYDIAGQIK